MLYLAPCKPSLNGPNGNYIVLNGWKLTAVALRMHNVTLHECVSSRECKESVWLHSISYTNWVFVLKSLTIRLGISFHTQLTQAWCEAVIAHCLRTKGAYCGRKFDLVVPEQNHSSSGYMEFFQPLESATEHLHVNQNREALKPRLLTLLTSIAPPPSNRWTSNKSIDIVCVRLRWTC